MKLAPIALVVACVLVGCGSTTPTTPPPSPARSPVAHVDASVPVVNGVQAPPSSGVPAPSASAAPQPTPTPDAEAVRTAAGAQYLAAALAAANALEALVTEHEGTEAEIWGQFSADLMELQVPADTAADLHGLVRKVQKVQGLNLEASGHLARMADFYVVARHLRNARSRMDAAVDRVRSDLHLPALCRAGCPDQPVPRWLFP